MLDLLLEKDRKEIKKEYFFKFLNIFFTFIIIIFIAGHLSILPLFNLVSYQNKTIDENLDQFKNSKIAERQKEVENEMEKLATNFEVFAPDTIKYSGFIKRIERAALVGVKINSIVFKQIKNSETEKVEGLVIDIGGIAKRRKTLVEFVAEIENLKIFDLVDLPLSNLTKEFDTTFNIRAETKKLIID